MVRESKVAKRRLMLEQILIVTVTNLLAAMSRPIFIVLANTVRGNRWTGVAPQLA